MDTKKIKKFIELAKENNASKLSYEEKDFKISVSFEDSSPVGTYVPQVTHSVGPAPIGAQSSSSNKVEDHLHVVRAPFIGTFYSSPAPGEPSYIGVGDTVEKGQTLCILEAMKIMNEIEADTKGKIVEVCVENESFVEFGQALFKVEKA